MTGKSRHTKSRHPMVKSFKRARVEQVANDLDVVPEKAKVFQSRSNKTKRRWNSRKGNN